MLVEHELRQTGNQIENLSAGQENQRAGFAIGVLCLASRSDSASEMLNGLVQVSGITL